MTPPDLPQPQTCDGARAGTAVFGCLTVLRKRAEFLAAARARRAPVAGFLLQARQRADSESAEGIRVGFTCSKKVGNSVVRNRAKRRLREVARLVLTRQGRPGWDYVLIGKPDATVSRNFAALLDDMSRALERVHG